MLDRPKPQNHQKRAVRQEWAIPGGRDHKWGGNRHRAVAMQNANALCRCLCASPTSPRLRDAREDARCRCRPSLAILIDQKSGSVRHGNTIERPEGVGPSRPVSRIRPRPRQVNQPPAPTMSPSSLISLPSPPYRAGDSTPTQCVFVLSSLPSAIPQPTIIGHRLAW